MDCDSGNCDNLQEKESRKVEFAELNNGIIILVLLFVFLVLFNFIPIQKGI